MNSIVIYASRYGNTRKIAESIAAGLRPYGTVRLLIVDAAPSTLPAGTDLVVIGGPTESHGLTEPIMGFFDRLAPGALQGMAAAAFDTRLSWPRWLSGSAAAGIAHWLRQASAQVIVPAESFFIKGALGTGGRDSAELEAGELERAAAWAATLADAVTSRRLAPATTATSAGGA